jgi:serine/threonine-protein kinase
MGLEPGTRLGAHEIVGLLGAGGMGEVYRATDTRLKRDVAIKVLPQAFAQDPDRLARFQREAELLASLNHPNIAAIYGLEQVDGVVGIVLELVEGETLADVIARGPLAPVDALPIARQICEALEAAHDKGVVHRDLKPANVKVTRDGRVKVLDFGLAKMLETDPKSSAMSMSPTLSVHATYAGVILGTAAYMSPEQARGRPVDRRTDVWAFGCVLFEMLTGKHAFEPGETVSDAIASVLTREPDVATLPADTPPAIRRLLRRCLQKDPQQRLPHIGAARLEIDEARGGSPEDAPTAVATVLERARVADRGWRRSVPWAIAAASLVMAGIVVVTRAPWRSAAFQAPVRLSSDVGATVSFFTAVNLGAAVAMSPDGGLIALVVQRTATDRPQLYLRRLDQLDATPLPGTEGATNPFFSPDGQWIGFTTAGTVKKISVAGGAVIGLGEYAGGGNRGATWTDDGTIIFGSTAGSLMRISSEGGRAEPVGSLAEGEMTQRWPQILPGGKAVLFTSHISAGAGFDDANIVVQPLPSGPRKIVQRGGSYARYLPSGHLVYLRGGTLFAVPFDLRQLEATGPQVPVLEGVWNNPNQGSGHFAVSATGTLVYRPNRGTLSNVAISWMESDGKTTRLRPAAADWTNLIFAPDGRRLAMDISDGRQTDVWVYEWAPDRLTRLTWGPRDSQKPVWTPDGSRIAFGSTRDGTLNLYWQRADGTGEVQRLTNSPYSQGAWSFHPNGRLLAYHELSAANQDDVLVLPIEGDEASGWKPGKPTVFVNGPFAERAPMFSPDGRWIAYQSTETGRDEVWVRPYPGPGGKWLISTGGGTTPTWSRTRRELFYTTNDQQIMVAPYAVVGDSFQAEKPRLWADAHFVMRQRTGPTRSFDLHPDGTRFALAAAETATQTREDKLVFVFNFFDELRRRVPVK